MPDAAPYNWEKERETLTDMEVKQAIPDAEFPGHKGIYLANLEGWLGSRFPVLLRERDDLREQVQAVIPLIESVREFVTGTGPGAFKFDGKKMGEEAETEMLCLIGQLPDLHRALSRGLLPDPAAVCACGHTAKWHSHRGLGDCEHDGRCRCTAFEAAA